VQSHRVSVLLVDSLQDIDFTVARPVCLCSDGPKGGPASTNRGRGMRQVQNQKTESESVLGGDTNGLSSSVLLVLVVDTDVCLILVVDADISLLLSSALGHVIDETVSWVVSLIPIDRWKTAVEEVESIEEIVSLPSLFLAIVTALGGSH